MFKLFDNQSPARSVGENFDADPARLTLYHFQSCPFCARVRDTLAQLELKIAMKDILTQTGAREELIGGGGRKTVPCLRIEGADGEVEWMYESLDIIAFLKRHFDN